MTIYNPNRYFILVLLLAGVRVGQQREEALRHRQNLPSTTTTTIIIQIVLTYCAH
jgi:hypothetical protein